MKTTLPVLSSINQHMLSCVWHGVYRALTAISPILKPSPFFGVCVTPSQSLPPITDLPLNSGSASCQRIPSAVDKKGVSDRCIYKLVVSSSMIPMTAQG